MKEQAVRVATRLREAGHQAFLAGGCVRDRLRGVEPADYDIATSARPAEVQALFARTVAVGAAFGVVLVVEGEHSCEVATFREDIGIADGRHPASVRFADARADAARRDFTINGMFEDPETGEILDFVGGQADLKARTVRAIGDPVLRFREDRLRMLRAVRFATVFEFVLEPATRAAIDAEAHGLLDVSAERIGSELSKIVSSGRGGRGLGLLFDTGLLHQFLPEIVALDRIPQPAIFHPEGDVLTHTRMLLDSYREGIEAVALAALLHDVAKAPTFCLNDKGRYSYPKHAPVGTAMAETILRRLRYPNRVVDQVKALIRGHMDWPALPKMRTSKQRRFLMREDFALHAELHRLDCEACHRDFGLLEYAHAERARIAAEPPVVRPLLSGAGLIDLGFAPGPPFRIMLEALVDAQLERHVESVDEARAFVLEHFAPPDGRRIAGDATR